MSLTRPSGTRTHGAHRADHRVRPCAAEAAAAVGNNQVELVDLTFTRSNPVMLWLRNLDALRS
jgi:hypothetical protein